jgi:hypothetical protein
VGVSRIHLTIDRLVLNGLERGQEKALVESFRTELSKILADRRTRSEWAHSHRTPVLKLGRVPMESGAAGGGKLGVRMAGAIGRGLKP